VTIAAHDPREALFTRDVRPIITPPRGAISGAAFAILCAVLAIGLFLLLDARRRALTTGHGAFSASLGAPAAPPPPLVVPPALPALRPAPIALPAAIAPRPSPLHLAAPTRQVTAAPLALSPAQSAPATTTAKEPPILIDLTNGTGGVAEVETRASAAAAPADNDGAVRATVIRNRQSLISQGTLLSAVLETPLNSDRPGLVRALVSRDARSFDGSRVLIPRGSRLIGEFKADTNPDQRRVLVTWTRLIRPDGVAIRIGSPAADTLGGSGIAGRVNTHFLERFANAVLQSALTIGVEQAARRGSDSVFVGVPGQVGQSLLPNIAPRTTIKVREGAEIAIFVARDLDFSGTPPVR
jgi:type IV secretion system protein VirB10